MTIFSIIAAALALVALLTVVLPLFRSHRKFDSGASPGELNVAVYRDQLAQLAEDLRTGKLDDDQYRSARGELERRVLEDVPDTSARVAARSPLAAQGLAIAVGVAVPLLAVPMYLLLGNPALLSARQEAGAHGAGAQQIDALVRRLAARLAEQPNDGQGWTMLARSYAALGRFGEASSAYARSVAVFADDAQLLADYADSLAMARGGRLQGEPEKLVERALRVDPNNPKALALAGTIAFDNKNYASAVNHWERLQGLIPAGSEFANSIKASIGEAKAMAVAGGGTSQATSALDKTQAPAPR